MRILLITISVFVFFTSSLFAQVAQNSNSTIEHEILSAEEFFSFEKSVYSCADCDPNLSLNIIKIRNEYAPNLPDEDSMDIYEAFDNWKKNFEHEFNDYTEFLKRQKALRKEKNINPE